MFNLPDDDTFSPRLWKLVNRLREDSQDQKVKLLQSIHKFFKESSKNDRIEKARKAIEDFLKKPSVGPCPFSSYYYLTIRGGILERDGTRMMQEKRFFKKELFDPSEENAKIALRYFEVRDATAEGDALYALPFHLTFEPLYLTEIEEGSVEKATIINDVERWRMLPVLFVPDVTACNQQCEQTFRLYGRIEMAYCKTPPLGGRCYDVAKNASSERCNLESSTWRKSQHHVTRCRQKNGQKATKYPNHRTPS